MDNDTVLMVDGESVTSATGAASNILYETKNNSVKLELDDHNIKIGTLTDQLTTSTNEPFKFDKQDGKYGYIIKEADTDVFVPFKSGESIEDCVISSISGQKKHSNTNPVTYTTESDIVMIAVCYTTERGGCCIATENYKYVAGQISASDVEIVDKRNFKVKVIYYGTPIYITAWVKP